MFEARLVGADGRKIERLDIGAGEEAEAFRRDLELATFTVASVEAKPAKRHPSPPFTTSTLQQEASRKLGLAPAQTMRIAQRLYEGVDIGGETVGLITYMRTDGIDMAPEAIAAARAGSSPRNTASATCRAFPRKYQNKAKNAQEAHEASARPTWAACRPAAQAPRARAGEALRADLDPHRREPDGIGRARAHDRGHRSEGRAAPPRPARYRPGGEVRRFPDALPGGKDDEADEDQGRPPDTAGDPLERRRIAATQHFTEPPPRYSEASLVKRMEELGIGRPSTYASILAVLREREYVRLEKKRLVAEDKEASWSSPSSRASSRSSSNTISPPISRSSSTAPNSEIDWKQVLREFLARFSAAVGETKELRTAEILDALNDLLARTSSRRADGASRSCPSCGIGQLSLRLGKFGAFIGCSNYPGCRYTRQLMASGGDADAESFGDEGTPGVKLVGEDPSRTRPPHLARGRFGVSQLGEAAEKGDKPKRSSPAGRPARRDRSRAGARAARPAAPGRHASGIRPADPGRHRALRSHVQHGKTFANLEKDDDVLAIGEPCDRPHRRARKRRRLPPRRGARPSRQLGEDPSTSKTVVVKAGRFGPMSPTAR